MTNDIYVSFVPEIDKQTAPEKRLLSDVMEEIRNGTYTKEIEAIREPGITKDERDTLKEETLPVFSPSAILIGTRHFKENTEPTGIAQFDLDLKDHYDSKGKLTIDVEDIRSRIIGIDECIYCLNIS